MASPLIEKYQPSTVDAFQCSEGLLISAELGHRFVGDPEVKEKLTSLYGEIDMSDPNALMIRSFAVSKLLRNLELPADVVEQLRESVEELGVDDDSLLILRGEEANPLDSPTRARGLLGLQKALSKHYTDHFTNGLIHLGEDPSYEPFSKLKSLVVQKADSAECSGVVVTYDPKTKATAYAIVYSTWGQAEDILRRSVSRDEYWFHRHALSEGQSRPIFTQIGEKQFQLRYDPDSDRLEHLPLSRDKARRPSLSAEVAHQLATLALEAEEAAGHPVELSWSSNGESTKILALRKLDDIETPSLKFYRRIGDGTVIAQGRAAAHAVASGRVRIIHSRQDLDDFKQGEVMIARRTEPDWEPGFRKASAIITTFDRRVSHSTILAREMGIPAVLETPECETRFQTGDQVTVSCCEGEIGKIFEGQVEHDVEEFDLQNLPELPTKLMVNLSLPERAVTTAQLPWAGAGLIRSEFMIGGWVKVHPNALLNREMLPPEVQRTVDRLCRGTTDGAEYFAHKMSQAIGLFASAFWPRPVTIRLSDFKSNEYARLVGGELFEPKETNSMLGWRGASRYLHEDYRDAFLLELEAIRRVRAQGFTNIRVLIPFCRTPEEGEEVLDLLSDEGLRGGDTGLETWCMAELPSNVFLADDFAALFDGMSIGSSDLTSLSLGIARNAEKVAADFDEMHPAMMKAYETIIEACHGAKKPVSFCGQIASEDPEFAALLTEMGIDIISLAPDAFRPTLVRLSQ